MNPEYKIGQIWNYQTRNGEEKSKITIVKVSNHEHCGTIVNIAIDNVKIKSSYVEDGYLNAFSHLPFNKEAIDNSVTNLVGTTDDLSESQEGYAEWKEQFDLGKAGIFTGTVAETISILETSMNQ